MAASGSQTIQLYYSTSSGTAPVAGNLASGELAINITDGKLYYKDNSGVVQTLATKAATSGSFSDITVSGNATLSGGTANGVLYLNGSKVATSGSALTFDGTNLKIGSVLSTGNLVLSVDNSANSMYVGGGSFSPTELNLQANSFIRSYIGGSEQMRLTSTGLGIGTTSPAGKLDIAGSTATFRFNTSGTEFYNTNAGAVKIYASNAAGYLSFGSAGTDNQMVLNTSGNLGIGTSSPQYKLHVAQSSSAVVFGQDSTTANIIGTNAAGTASQGLFLKGFPLTFTGNGGGGAEHMRLDSSGNLGLGVTPSAWGLGKAIEIGSAGNSVWGPQTRDLRLMANVYYTGSQYNYVTTGFAARYDLNNGTSGGHAWFTAPSGTAGNAITFTQAMTLGANGNLLVGLTSPALSSRLEVKSSNNALAGFTGADASGTSYFVNTNGSGQVNHYATWATSGVNAYHAWWVTASSGVQAQAMTLDASGNLLLGTTSSGGRLTVDSGSTGLMGTFNSTNANGGYFVYQASGTTYGDIGTAAQAVSGSASDFGINARGSRNLVLGTNNLERARIDSSGRMGLGTSSPDANYYLTVGVTSSDVYAAARFNRGTTSSTTSIAFANPNGVVGTVSTSGTSTAYNTSSDYRLKHDIAPMTGALAKVAALKPVTYKWNTDNSNGEGFIAHELAEVVPQAVTGEKDAVDADGNPVYQGIDTSFLVATLTAALQEAHGLIKDLQARVEALEAK